ncbi:YjgF-like protein [Nadsonia fulvescens var. elongata DSM 6958]|uniref:YjgF-like protein n=1 Tax=Nadsonia fulvescens var. elongata DSM 6958 TaxID=857566 RepID=A0A1E3PMR8_9ASCO|nr:YjgF-like protein [Nadsonia fulvescens var. elongata DSM 6958]
MQPVTYEDINEESSASFLLPAWKSNGHVFTSGQVGTDANGNLPEDLAEQTRNAFANLKKVLEASGSGLDKILKVLLFISDGSYSSVVNKIYAETFPHKPARSCIVVSFPNKALKVELECVAEYEDLTPKL